MEKKIDHNDGFNWIVPKKKKHIRTQPNKNFFLGHNFFVVVVVVVVWKFCLFFLSLVSAYIWTNEPKIVNWLMDDDWHLLLLLWLIVLKTCVWAIKFFGEKWIELNWNFFTCCVYQFLFNYQVFEKIKFKHVIRVELKISNFRMAKKNRTATQQQHDKYHDHLIDWIIKSNKLLILAIIIWIDLIFCSVCLFFNRTNFFLSGSHGLKCIYLFFFCSPLTFKSVWGKKIFSFQLIWFVFNH